MSWQRSVLELKHLSDRHEATENQLAELRLENTALASKAAGLIAAARNASKRLL